MGLLDVFKVVDWVVGDKCPHCGNKSLWNQLEKKKGWLGGEKVYCDNCKRWFKVKK